MKILKSGLMLLILVCLLSATNNYDDLDFKKIDFSFLPDKKNKQMTTKFDFKDITISDHENARAVNTYEILTVKAIEIKVNGKK